MTQEELNKAIELHNKWLKRENAGVRMNLHGADMRELNLAGVDLSYAVLTGADLSGSHLREADLSHADLSYADLRGSCLDYANLEKASFNYANLRNASLIDVNAGRTVFSDADLRSSDLRWAALIGAHLVNANISNADLRGANLKNAKLKNSITSNVEYDEGTIFFAMQCPEEGSFIGFKKVHNHIIKLEIPADAKRSSATSRKCRCEFAKVLEIADPKGNKVDFVVNYAYAKDLLYKVGEMVYADKFDEDRWNECSHGIHFFITRREAEMY